MKRLRKLVGSLLIIASIMALVPIGASAEWKQDANGWWYTNGSSWYTGWKEIYGKWYYFDNNGYRAVNKVIDNKYYVDSNGAWDGITKNVSNQEKIEYYFDIDLKTTVTTPKTYTFVNNRGGLSTTDNPKMAENEVLIDNYAGKMLINGKLQDVVNNGVVSYEEFTKVADDKMLELVNAHRKDKGSDALEWDNTIAAMATEKSEHMQKHNYMAHEYKGYNTSWVQDVAWKIYTTGENCLANYKYPLTRSGAVDMATSMFNQWKDSPGHDRAMLEPDHKYLGFGFAFGDSSNTYESYATQKFSDESQDDFKWTSDLSYINLVKGGGGEYGPQFRVQGGINGIK